MSPQGITSLYPTGGGATQLGITLDPSRVRHGPQYSVSLQTEESIQEEFQRRRGQPVSFSTHARHQESCLHTSRSSFSLPIPLGSTPGFSTNIGECPPGPAIGREPLGGQAQCHPRAVAGLLRPGAAALTQCSHSCCPVPLCWQPLSPLPTLPSVSEVEAAL